MVIKTFVVQAFVIPSGSMQNTLAINDKILVNKLVYDFRAIKPGDIVVFNGDGSWNVAPPSGSNSNLLARMFDDTVRRAVDSVGGLFGTPVGQTDYVKRVIGVPGDRVSCCTAQGLLTVNGVPLHEQSYLYPGNKPGSAPEGIQGHFSVTVPPGYLWVLGDHRAISDDSRGHRDDPGNGMIPESKVIGRAFVIVWPPSHWRILPIPATFDQPGVDQRGVDRTGVARGTGARPSAAACDRGVDAREPADGQGPPGRTVPADDGRYRRCRSGDLAGTPGAALVLGAYPGPQMSAGWPAPRRALAGNGEVRTFRSAGYGAGPAGLAWPSAGLKRR